MDEQLNEDGLPAGQPVTADQIRQAEMNRTQRIASAGSDDFRIFTQQAQRKQRRRRAEDEQQP